LENGYSDGQDTRKVVMIKHIVGIIVTLGIGIGWVFG
jgi:hypothetical protein